MTSIELTKIKATWNGSQTNIINDTKVTVEIDDNGLWGYCGDNINFSAFRVILHHAGVDTFVNTADCTFSITKISSLGDNAVKISYTRNFDNTVTVSWEGNFNVYGCRMIFDFQVQYAGSSIGVMQKIDTKDIIVTINRADYDDHNMAISEILGPSDYSIASPGLVITDLGDNERTVLYDDGHANHWSKPFTVQGEKQIADFDAQYSGATKLVGEPVHASEVTALISWIIKYDWKAGDITTIERPLDEGESITFLDEPIVRKENNGFIRVQYKDYVDSITVPYRMLENIYLLSWYEGLEVEVGKPFHKQDVVAILVLGDKWESRRRLSYLLDNLVFSDVIVNNAGWNLYYVSYVFEGVSYKQWFCVKGYVPTAYPEKEFQILYDDKANDRWIDFTDKFRRRFEFGDVLRISWNQFLLEVNEIMLYGIYMLTAPPQSGLSARFTEDWEVRCINSQTIKSKVFKTYHKEEDLSWQVKRKVITMKQWQEENSQLPKN